MCLVKGSTKSGFAWDSNAFVLGHYATQTSIITWAINISQLLIIPYNNILNTNVVQLCTLLLNCIFIKKKEMEFMCLGGFKICTLFIHLCFKVHSQVVTWIHISHAWITFFFLEFIFNLSCSNSPHHILEMPQWYNGHHPQQRLRKKYLPLLKFLMNCFILPWVSFCHVINGLCASSHVIKKHATNSHDQNYVKNKLWSLTKKQRMLKDFQMVDSPIWHSHVYKWNRRELQFVGTM